MSAYLLKVPTSLFTTGTEKIKESSFGSSYGIMIKPFIGNLFESGWVWSGRGNMRYWSSDECDQLLV